MAIIQKRDKDRIVDLFDTALTELPPPRSRSIVCRQSRVYREVEETSVMDVLKYAAFYRKVLKFGDHATTLADFHLIEEWIEILTFSGFVVLYYVYSCIYNHDTVPILYIALSPETSSSMLSSQDFVVFVRMDSFLSLRVVQPKFTTNVCQKCDHFKCGVASQEAKRK